MKSFPIRALAFAFVVSLAASVPSITMARETPGGNHKGGAKVKIGYLECHEAAGWGLILGVNRNLRCTYSGASGSSSRYTGQITKVGVDIGYLSSAVMLWGVVAPSNNIPAGALAGTYGGVTGEAAVGYGAGASVLIGGFKHSIELNPLTISGEKGLNVAAGVEALTLHYVGSVKTGKKAAAK